MKKLYIVLLLCVLLCACNGANQAASTPTTPTTPTPPDTAKEWTWVSGISTVPAGALGQAGVYGTQGVAAATNVPGGRQSPVCWTDSSSNLWLFGGAGVDSKGKYGGLNDLWEFNSKSNAWTWVSGANIANAVGLYGAQSVATASNVPGGRGGAISWIDRTGNLWLFGGSGSDSSGYAGLLNDLWEFNPTDRMWTWVSGSIPSNTEVGQTGTFAGQTGVYESPGVAAASNVPGGREGAVSWIDRTGNLWLFGGNGFDSAGTQGYLNDLWEFNNTTNEWTWMSGANTANAAGVYGTLGVADATNVPGGRSSSVTWTDASGNLWLFGGGGLDSIGTGGSLNDLWEFSPTANTWTWISGSSTANAVGVYGTQGVAASSNFPGARYSAVSWIDSSGNLWLFGGVVWNASTGASVFLNDLWEFDSAAKTWTWMSGADTPDEVGVYGTQGVAASSNFPGARYSAVSWIDGSGNLWLFGGGFFDSNVNILFNDLWRYQP